MDSRRALTIARWWRTRASWTLTVTATAIFAMATQQQRHGDYCGLRLAALCARPTGLIQPHGRRRRHERQRDGNDRRLRPPSCPARHGAGTVWAASLGADASVVISAVQVCIAQTRILRQVYSTFCTCSLTCSISTLISTACRVVSASADFDPSVFASRFSS